MRIIMVPQKATEAVTVMILVATGSKYEHKENNGISHLLEHLLFKGTKKRPTPLSISEPLDRVGGIYNAFTGEEYTGYFAKVGKNHFGLALDILSDIYLNSTLKLEELEREKKVVIEEINMYFDNPARYVHNLWTKVLYGDQPAGWDIAGTKETVLALSRDQIHDYMKKQYVAPSTVICVAGNISEENVLKEVQERFLNIGSDGHFSKPGVREDQKNPTALVFYKKTDQTHFCLGFRGYSLFHPRRHAIEILGVILGGMMSSRMFLGVREKLGLAYYVSTEVTCDTDTGFIVTSAGVDNLRVELAVQAVLKEYQKVLQRDISSDELDKAKEHIKGKTALMLEASDAQASFYGIQELLEDKIQTQEEFAREIDKITLQNINEVAQDVFRPEKLSLALIGPFEDQDKFRKLLVL